MRDYIVFVKQDQDTTYKGIKNTKKLLEIPLR